MCLEYSGLHVVWHPYIKTGFRSEVFHEFVIVFLLITGSACSCVPVMEHWPLENSGTISIKVVEEGESLKD